MFKKIAAMAGLLVLFGAQAAFASLGSDPQRPDIVGWGADRDTAPIVGIDFDGDIIPARNRRNDLGESTRAWRAIHGSTLNITGGIANFTESFMDLPNGLIDGFASGGFTISTTNLIDQTSTYYDNNLSQSSGAPRNVVIYSSVNALGVTTTTVTGSCTFYGYDSLGRFTSEGISFTTATLLVIGSTGTGIGIGNVPFVYITSFTSQVTSATLVQTGNPNFILIIGWGNKIGLANDITTSSAAYKTTGPGGSDITNSVKDRTNTDYNTVHFPTPFPNAVNDWKVWYTATKSPAQ